MICPVLLLLRHLLLRGKLAGKAAGFLQVTLIAWRNYLK